MTNAFDFAPLLRAGLPPAAAKFTGVPKYNFVGGHGDPDQFPVDGVIAAANSALRREGRTLATYGFGVDGPQGHRGLREFLVKKLKSDAGIDCTIDNILITSGSLQALDLVNGVFLAPGDTVVIERTAIKARSTATPGSASTRSASRSTATACGSMRCRTRSTTSSVAACGRNSSIRFRPCRIRPARSCRKTGAWRS